MDEKIIDVEEKDILPATNEDVQKASEPLKVTEEDLEFNETIFDDSINKDSILEAAKQSLGVSNISDSEMIEFMDLVNRIKNKEHITNLFAQLPKTFKIGIDKTLKENGCTDLGFYDLMAKQLIEDIVGSSSFNKIVEEYNTELYKINTDLKNGKTLISAQSDTLRDSILIKYKEIVDKCREEGKDDVANYYENIIDSYKKAYSLEIINNLISEKESFVNRCYKERNHFDEYCRVFDKKFCIDYQITNKEGESIKKPNIRTLESAYNSLKKKYNEDIAKTICVMVYFGTIDMSLDKIEESTYVYFLLDALYILDKASDIGDAIEEITHSLNVIIDKIQMVIINKNNKKSKKR